MGLDGRKLALMLFLQVPFFRPEFVISYGGDVASFILCAWLGVTLVVSAFMAARRRTMDWKYALTLLPPMTVLLSTLVNHGSLEIWYVQWGSCIAISTLVFAAKGYCIKEFLAAIVFWTGLCLIVNFESVILFPGGLWPGDINHAAGDHFFYGHRNQIFSIALPAIGASSLLDCMACRHVSLRTGVFMAVSFCTALLAPSLTSSIAIGLLSTVILLRRLPGIAKICNALVYAISAAVVFLGIVVLKIQNYFSGFLLGAFGKNATISGRTIIWSKIPDFLQGKEILLGAGMHAWSYIDVGGRAYSAHNQFLHLWCIGGAVSLLAMLALLAACVTVLFKSRRNAIAFVLAASLGAFFVVGTTETAISFGYWMFIALVLSQFWVETTFSIIQGTGSPDEAGSSLIT